MFKQFVDWYIFRQVSKYNAMVLFRETMDSMHVRIGDYGVGLGRDFAIIFDDGTTENHDLRDATIRFNEHFDMVITGVNKTTTQPFRKIIRKETIRWQSIQHVHDVDVDDELDMYWHDDEGVLDISLSTGESVILSYSVNNTKNQIHVS